MCTRGLLQFRLRVIDGRRGLLITMLWDGFSLTDILAAYRNNAVAVILYVAEIVDALQKSPGGKLPALWNRFRSGDGALGRTFHVGDHARQREQSAKNLIAEAQPTPS